MTPTPKRPARTAPTTGGRCALYLRVSSPGQALDEKSSLGLQRAKCEAVLGTLAGTPTVVRVFEEPGFTATKALGKRPVGARLMADAKAGHFDIVIVWSLDRFARNAREGLADLKALEDLGVAVVFVKERIDTSTATGRMFQTFLLAMAQWEAETMRERTSGGAKARAVKGYWAGNRLPYGLTTDDAKRVVLDPARAEVVRLIFRLRAEGTPMVKIAEALNARGIPSPLGRRWSMPGVRGIVGLGGVYASGQYATTIGGTLFPFTFEPVLTPALAQEAGAVVTPSATGANASLRLRDWPLSRHLYHDHAGLIGVRSTVVGRSRGALKRQAKGGGGKTTLTSRIPAPEGHRGHPVSSMRGEPREDGRLTYLCTGSKNRPDRPADCPGLAATRDGTGLIVNTAWPAADLEARVFLDIARLLGSTTSDGPAIDLDALLRVGEAEVIDTLRTGEDADRKRLAAIGPTRKALRDELEEESGAGGDLSDIKARLARLKAEEADILARLARLEADSANRGTFTANLRHLLTMTIEDTGEAGEETEATGAQVFVEGAGAIAALIDPATGRATADLPVWAREALSTAVTALGAVVTVRYNEEAPSRPEVEVRFDFDRLGGSGAPSPKRTFTLRVRAAVPAARSRPASRSARRSSSSSSAGRPARSTAKVSSTETDLAGPPGSTGRSSRAWARSLKCPPIARPRRRSKRSRGSAARSPTVRTPSSSRRA